MRELLAEQKRYINAYFDRLDLTEMEAVLADLHSCQGTIFVSGVGKSGHIAQKISATLASVGVKSLFLSPVEAVHGALGLVEEKDLLLAFSKSGETRELIDLISFVREKGARVVGVVSRRLSRLSEVSDRVVFLPVERELCPYDMAPTISTSVQMLFGDLLAIALMKRKGFTIQGFAQNHPGGFLGRRTSRVKDLMRKGEELPLAKRGDLLLDLLPELSAKKCGCLLVVDEKGRLEGIFTDGDLRRCLQTKGVASLSQPMEEMMVLCPKTIDGDSLIHEAILKMEEGPLITVLPVVEGDQLRGLIRMHDILQSSVSALR